MSNPRFITLVCQQPPMTVTALRGDTGPIPQPGTNGTGWNEIARPKRQGLTEWEGWSPLRVLLPLLIGVTPNGDCAALDTSAEADRQTLENMSQPASTGDEPPILRVVGAMPHSDKQFFIENFDWDATPLYSAKGFLTRQAVTVHLCQYVRDDRISDANAAQIARNIANTERASSARSAGGTSNQQPKKKVYVVKAGDTLSRIAATQLGNYKRWPDIASINNIRDPKSIFQSQTLKLP